MTMFLYNVIMKGTDMNAEVKTKTIALNLSNLFKNRREELNLTPKELGKKAGVSYTVIYDLEKRFIIPKIETISKLAEALDIEFDGLQFTPLLRKAEDIEDSFKIIKDNLVILGFDRDKINSIIDYMNFKLVERGVRYD